MRCDKCKLIVMEINNDLYQATRGNYYDNFKLLFGLGNDLDYKKSRNHKCIDLTTK